LPACQKENSIAFFEEIFPGDTNAYGTAFGGKILALMDRAAGLAASRFAHCDFVTASLEAMEFIAPVKQGEIAEVTARVVYTSTHTCAVKVQVFALQKNQWEQKSCCLGHFFMVAVDANGRPQPITQFKAHDKKTLADWNDAASIHRSMLARKRAGD
jgi:acyl-CoA hydrolase